MQTDAEGRTTRWTYDAVGRQTNRTLSLGQIENFGYDANGNRTSHTDIVGETHTFDNDVNDCLITESYADGAEKTHVYDAKGNRMASTIVDTGRAPGAIPMMPATALSKKHNPTAADSAITTMRQVTRRG